MFKTVRAFEASLLLSVFVLGSLVSVFASEQAAKTASPLVVNK